MKVGDLVIYTEGGKDYNALVLGARNFADHDGANGEPTVTLAFAKERLDAFGHSLPVRGQDQASSIVRIRLDVAHTSHSYSEDQRSRYGRSQYDGGRWKEVASSTAIEALIGGHPTAEDLDAVADEQAAKDATKGEN